MLQLKREYFVAPRRIWVLAVSPLALFLVLWGLSVLGMDRAIGGGVAIFLETTALFGCVAGAILAAFRSRMVREMPSRLLMGMLVATLVLQAWRVCTVLGIAQTSLSSLSLGASLAVGALWATHAFVPCTVGTSIGGLALGLVATAWSEAFSPWVGPALIAVGGWRVWRRDGGEHPVLTCALLSFALTQALSGIVEGNGWQRHTAMAECLHVASFLPIFLGILVLNLSDFAMVFRNSRFLESVLEHIPSMIFVKDAEELRFEMFNLAGERLLGMNRKDLLGRNDHDFFPKEQADHFIQKDREVLEKGELLEIPEEPLDTGGGRRWLHTRKIPIMHASGKPAYLLGISEDVTEARELRRELEQTQWKAVQQSKMAALGQMAAGMAHEINNPLGIIMGNVDKLEILSRRNVPVEQLEPALEKIRQTCGRISKIIHALRNYSRDLPDSPKEVVLASHLVQETLSLCQERFRHHGVELRLKGDLGLELFCRPVELSQVLLNLLNNAFDAVEALEEKWVEVEIAGDDQWVRLSVRDSGFGISREIADRLTEPFFTTKPVGKGTGLGLSISKGIVERHGGALGVDLNDSHTCFVVTIPVRAKVSRAA